MELIRDIRAKRHISRYAFACFIGFEPDAIWDIDDYEDEAWSTLTLLKAVKVCVLLDVDIKFIIPSNVKRAASVSIVYAPDRYVGSGQLTNDGATQVSWTLRGLLGEKINDEEFTGWDANALVGWLVDDVSMGQMPIQAFEDICLALQISVEDVLTEYYRNFGR